LAKGELTIEAVNQRLKLANVGVSVRQKGKRLYLRATLPPKPASTKVKPFQQDVALKLYANPAGIERAEAEARKMGALLACKEFDWSLYTTIEPQGDSDKTCGHWIERFKQHCLETNLQRKSQQQSELLWRERYYNPALKWLPEHKELDAAVIITAAQRAKPNSRSRQMACHMLQQFAKFAGIEVDLKPYVGNYSPKKVVRKIPADDLIIASIDKFNHLPEWRNLYGLMATYGLRNHEVFYTKLDWQETEEGRVLVAAVQDGKTGARKVYPFYPEWVDRWELWNLRLPNLTCRLNQDYGERIARAFKRVDIPFAPYNLRHAYAIRISVVFKLPVAVAASFMGHSPTIHWQTYNRWISEDQYQRIYEDVLRSSNRPTI
jgi:integrase